MRHLVRLTAPAVGCLLALLTAACGGSKSPTAPVDPGVLPSMDSMLAEKSIGASTAPNTIVEFSSFTCPHCADFTTITFPQLKAKYIDTGSVRFVFRNSPRDSDVDLTAAMLARCAGDRYFDAVAAIFGNQGTWAASGDPTREIQALGQVMRNFGMSQQVIDACQASSTLRAGILQMKADGIQQYNYQGVPTFIVNPGTSYMKTVVGAQGLSAFDSALQH
jgi:protein-disulfide isomerase